MKLNFHLFKKKQVTEPEPEKQDIDKELNAILGEGSDDLTKPLDESASDELDLDLGEEKVKKDHHIFENEDELSLPKEVSDLAGGSDLKEEKKPKTELTEDEKRQKVLRQQDIDKMSADDLAKLSDFSVDDAKALVQEPIEEPVEEPVDEMDFDFDAEEDSFDKLEEEEEDFEEEEAEFPTELPEISPEEAFDHLTPVQQTILRQMENVDFQTRKTEAQLTEENLYMQGQIMEWSNAYAALMKRLEEWQEYGAKLHEIVAKQDAEFEEEKQQLREYHQEQLLSVRRSLEEDFQGRVEEVEKDRELAREALLEAKEMRLESKRREDEQLRQIENLQKQLVVISKHPSSQEAVPVAPSKSSAEIHQDIKNGSVGKKDPLFDDESWDK